MRVHLLPLFMEYAPVRGLSRLDVWRRKIRVVSVTSVLRPSPFDIKPAGAIGLYAGSIEGTMELWQELISNWVGRIIRRATARDDKVFRGTKNMDCPRVCSIAWASKRAGLER